MTRAPAADVVWLSGGRTEGGGENCFGFRPRNDRQSSNRYAQSKFLANMASISTYGCSYPFDVAQLIQKASTPPMGLPALAATVYEGLAALQQLRRRCNFWIPEFFLGMHYLIFFFGFAAGFSLAVFFLLPLPSIAIDSSFRVLRSHRNKELRQILNGS